MLQFFRNYLCHRVIPPYPCPYFLSCKWSELFINNLGLAQKKLIHICLATFSRQAKFTMKWNKIIQDPPQLKKSKVNPKKKTVVWPNKEEGYFDHTRFWPAYSWSDTQHNQETHIPMEHCDFTTLCRKYWGSQVMRYRNLRKLNHQMLHKILISNSIPTFQTCSNRNVNDLHKKHAPLRQLG